jgi:hypothetical protein
MASRRLLIVLIAIWTGLAAAGCGPSPPSEPDVLPTYNSFEELKPRLQRVAETGEGGSSLMDIESGLRMLGKVDAGKSERLLQDFRELERAPEADRRKELAREMLKKL